MTGIKKQGGGAEEKKGISVIAAKRPSLFAGVVPVVLRSVQTVLLKINGEFQMVRPGFARIANVSI